MAKAEHTEKTVTTHPDGTVTATLTTYGADGVATATTTTTYGTDDSVSVASTVADHT